MKIVVVEKKRKYQKGRDAVSHNAELQTTALCFKSRKRLFNFLKKEQHTEEHPIGEACFSIVPKETNKCK